MPPVQPSPDAPCPCGGEPPGRPYAGCCGRWHHGPQRLQAPTAAALMRSRYSAYVLGLADYLHETWHPRTRPERVDLDPGLRWLGLRVGACEAQDEDHATVAFVARSKRAGRAHRLVETSRFVREQGRWTYLDGDFGP